LSRKGGAYLIQAFANVAKRFPIKLDIVGEGLMTHRWKKLAQSLNCEQSITWYGRVDRREVLKIMCGSDVFVFPSISDCYPAVIAEALACGLPVVTTDVPGVGDMVDESCGIKVSAFNEKTIVDGLQEAMVRLVSNQDALDELRKGVLRRAEQFQFEEKMKKLLRIYKDLLDK
jgi:glycosyltransferase involved in cell wall biosynthesis